MKKNKISTLGYFKKRLRDNGFIVLDIFNNYSDIDTRKWTIIVNPALESVFITCSNTEDFDTPVFEFSGAKVKPKNIQVVTSSMEVIIEKMLWWKISNNNQDSPYFKTKQ
jgi:DNA-binding beta-propeller fold protein YncE